MSEIVEERSGGEPAVPAPAMPMGAPRPTRPEDPPFPARRKRSRHLILLKAPAPDPRHPARQTMEAAIATEHGHSPAEVAARINAPNRRSYLRDTVYGAIDGAVTTFAIVAGVAGAGLPTNIIIALGLANVLADGFSMAAGNYSGTKAELDNIKRIRAIEERHIAEEPEGERLELREILAGKGLEGQVLEEATDAIISDKTRWIDMMLIDEYGLSPVDPHPMRAAVATFLAFLAAGLVPLIPFLVGSGPAFAVSLALTGVVFFAIGTLKSRWSLAPWWRSGLETLFIGGAAAGIAYGVASLFRGL